MGEWLVTDPILGDVVAGVIERAKAEQRAIDAAICRRRADRQACLHKEGGSEFALQRMTEAMGCAEEIESS